MMLELILVRHAKSSRKFTGIDDIDRPLNGTGYEEGLAIAQLLRSKKHIPDVIISSVAVRAYSTALIFSKVLKSEIEFMTEPMLYEISTHDLLDFIHQLDSKHSSVMLVGHNPSFSAIAEQFNPDYYHVPTAGVVRFVFESDAWADIGDYNLKESEIFQP